MVTDRAAWGGCGARVLRVALKRMTQPVYRKHFSEVTPRYAHVHLSSYIDDLAMNDPDRMTFKAIGLNSVAYVGTVEQC